MKLKERLRKLDKSIVVNVECIEFGNVIDQTSQTVEELLTNISFYRDMEIIKEVDTTSFIVKQPTDRELEKIYRKR